LSQNRELFFGSQPTPQNASDNKIEFEIEFTLLMLLQAWKDAKWAAEKKKLNAYQACLQQHRS
jgi:hypothetical protein